MNKCITLFGLVYNRIFCITNEYLSYAGEIKSNVVLYLK